VRIVRGSWHHEQRRLSPGGLPLGA
jgi:hypothetical protein